MREPIYRKTNIELLDSSFMFLANHGLENASMRNLCDATGFTLGSIYYWFEDKDSMILECSKYGLEKVFTLVFNQIFGNIGNTNKFIENCFIILEKHKSELRFFHQIASSPIYGEEIRNKGKDMNYIFEKFAERLSKMLQCEVETVRPYAYMIKTALFHYILWDNFSEVEMQLSYICSNISSHLHTQA